MSITAMKYAIEALEKLAKYENPLTKVQIRAKYGGSIVTMYPHQVAKDAADVLSQAIAEAEQEQIPRMLIDASAPIVMMPHPAFAKQEPVIDNSAAIRIATALGWEPKREPLTDEQIMQAAGDTLDVYSCARAIEVAHGIKENT